MADLTESELRHACAAIIFALNTAVFDKAHKNILQSAYTKLVRRFKEAV